MCSKTRCGSLFALTHFLDPLQDAFKKTIFRRQLTDQPLEFGMRTRFGDAFGRPPARQYRPAFEARVAPPVQHLARDAEFLAQATNTLSGADAVDDFLLERRIEIPLLLYVHNVQLHSVDTVTVYRVSLLGRAPDVWRGFTVNEINSLSQNGAARGCGS